MKRFAALACALLWASSSTAEPRYTIAPAGAPFTGTGILTAEVPGQQKIDCVITMTGYTNEAGPATVTSTTVQAILDPTCTGAIMGPGAILLRPDTPRRGNLKHFKLFMPSGTDCGMGASLPFTLDDEGHFIVEPTKLPSPDGPCKVMILIPFGTIHIEPSK